MVEALVGGEHHAVGAAVCGVSGGVGVGELLALVGISERLESEARVANEDAVMELLYRGDVGYMHHPRRGTPVDLHHFREGARSLLGAERIGSAYY
jgi:hypothetical protein